MVCIAIKCCKTKSAHNRQLGTKENVSKSIKNKNFKLKQDNCVQCKKTDAAKLVLLNSD